MRETRGRAGRLLLFGGVADDCLSSQASVWELAVETLASTRKGDSRLPLSRVSRPWEGGQIAI